MAVGMSGKKLHPLRLTTASLMAALLLAAGPGVVRASGQPVAGTAGPEAQLSIPARSEVQYAVATAEPAKPEHPPAEAPRRLTLREAAQAALENNPSITAALRDEDAGKAQTRQARSGYYPRVEGRAVFTNGNNPVYVFGTLLGQQRFTAENFDINALNHPDPVNNLKGEVTLWQSIWEGGKTPLREKMAHRNESLKGRQTEQARQALLMDVVRHYFAVQLARENLAGARATLESARKSRERIQNLLDQGMVVKSDLLRMDVFVADVRRQELEAANQTRLAAAALMTDLAGAAPGEPDPATPLALMDVPVLAEAQAREEALKNRPELAVLREAVEIGKLRVREAQADFKPSIGAFSTVEANQGTTGGSFGANYVVGVQARLTLYDGHYRGAKVAEMKAEAAATEARLKQYEDLLALQAKDAWLRVGTAKAQHDVAAEAVGMAEESLRIVKNRYEAGMAVLTDLLNAETALLGARTNRCGAVYQYNLALAGLELAMGRLTLDSPIFRAADGQRQ